MLLWWHFFTPMNHILFVQFRTDQSLAHEQACVKETFSELRAPIVFVNGITDELSPSLLDNTVGVIFGGSGQLHLTPHVPKEPWVASANAFLKEILRRDIPFLGICFGMQFLGLHLGARVATHPTFEEVGTFPVTLFDAAQQDPLFAGIPHTFPGVFGHTDAVVDLPESLRPLAHTERVACQAFRVQGKSAWGILFHAEMNGTHGKERVLIHQRGGHDEYASSGLKETLDRFYGENLETKEILYRFAWYALGERDIAQGKEQSLSTALVDAPARD